MENFSFTDVSRWANREEREDCDKYFESSSGDKHSESASRLMALAAAANSDDQIQSH